MTRKEFIAFRKVLARFFADKNRKESKKRNEGSMSDYFFSESDYFFLEKDFTFDPTVRKYDPNDLSWLKA